MMFKKIQFKLVKNLDEARYFWELLTPRLTIYDEWEFRYCFYKYFNYELFFYVGCIKDEPIGLLPLQFNSNKNYLEFFGGSAMNDNRVFIIQEYEKYNKNFYNQINQTAKLEYIDGVDKFTKKLPLIDYQYFLELKNFKSIDDYIIEYFQGKELRELKRKLRSFESVSQSISLNNFQNIELLFDFNIKRFQKESVFLLPYRKSIYKDLLSLPFSPTLLTYTIDGKIEAVSLALIYKEQFFSFNSGINPVGAKHLDVFIRTKRIDYAIKNKIQIYKALSGNCGWKENWHFTKIPQYKFER